MSGKTKKLLRQIRKAAQKMPPVPVKTKMRVSGAEILARNKDAKDGKGNPIDKNKFYIVPATQPKNHQKVMKRLLAEGGSAAVNKYIAEVFAEAQQKKANGV